MTVERKAAPADKVSFKGNKENCDPPLAPIAEPVKAIQDPQAFRMNHGDFYGTIDRDIAIVSKKKSDVIVNSEFSSAEVAKKSRKIGKGLKFCKLVKNNFTNPSDSDNEAAN